MYRSNEFETGQGNALDSFDIPAFGEQLKPKVKEALNECRKEKTRKGVFFTPSLVVFTVLSLCLRRDLNQHAVVNWMFSKFRWLFCTLPSKLFSEGTLSHARMRIGTKVFLRIFQKVAAADELPTDFHGRSTVAFDGSTGTMVDTKENKAAFGKASAQNGEAGFPQLRMMAMLSVPLRKILHIEYDSYTGKGTGERRLMNRILAGFQSDIRLLFLLDAGLYAFELFESCEDYNRDFIIKAASNVKPKRIPGKHFADGSYLAVITKKVKSSQDGKWITKQITVRVIPFQIPGFQAARLFTNILDAGITARELAVHYHQRWDIEIAFDEIKTHQCATLRGHAPTVFRSKTPELVIQELYAMLIVYNCVRELMCEAAAIHNEAPLLLSFLETLQHIIDCVSQTTLTDPAHRRLQYNYLLYLIAESRIDRPKRPRINPRVVKVKSSKFGRKNDTHKSEYRNLEKDLYIAQEAD